jgi:hypothetical protein
MAGVKLIPLCVLVCSLCVIADIIVFTEEERIWYAQDYLHIVLDVDFSPVLHECQSLPLVLDQIKPGFSLLPVDFSMLHAYTNQICAPTAAWNNTHHIEKRQLVAFGALATATVFGMFSSIAIGRLNSRLQEAETKLTRGLVILRKTDTRLTAVEASLDAVNAKLIQQAASYDNRQAQLFLLQKINTHMDALDGHVAGMSRAWSSLMVGHLSLDLLNPRQWDTVFQRARNEAQRMGGQMPIDAALDLLQFPASFEAKGPAWRIFLHIPVLQEPLRLLRHLPVPLYLDDQTNHSARVVTLSSTSDYLLVTADDILHRQINRPELSSKCAKSGTRLVCHDLGVFFRQLSSTCLGSLFGRLTASATSRCTVSLPVNDWEIVPIDRNSYVVFSKKGRGIDILCRNGTRRTQIIQGIKKVELEAGCALSSNDFLTRRGQEGLLDVHLVAQPAWDPEDLEAAWTAFQTGNTKRAERLHHDLVALQRPPEPGRREDGDWIDRQLDPATEQGQQLLKVLAAAAATSSALLLGVVTFVVWRICRTRPEAGGPIESPTA